MKFLKLSEGLQSKVPYLQNNATPIKPSDHLTL